MRRDLSKMARGPEAAGALGRDGPPGLDGVLDAEGRPPPVAVLRIADKLLKSSKHGQASLPGLGRRDGEWLGRWTCRVSVTIEHCLASLVQVEV